MIKLTLKPQRNALLKGWDNELYALLQLSHKGKVNNKSNSKPLNLSIVLDRSGSMSGQPLEEAKKSAIMMIENLRESDKIVWAAKKKSNKIKSRSLSLATATTVR